MDRIKDFAGTLAFVLVAAWALLVAAFAALLFGAAMLVVVVVGTSVTPVLATVYFLRVLRERMR